MSMKLNDALVTNFSIADKEYDIDLSFNKVLDVFEILKEEEMTYLEQAQLIVHLLTGQELHDIKEVVDCWIYIKEHFLEIEKETVQYDLLGNPMPTAKNEEEQEKLILKRNELADELDCAPSQISYVLSTRFSNERGFDVESRRGLGGYIRIRKLQPESSNMVPAVTTYHIYEGPNRVERLIDLRDVDQSLFQLLQDNKITKREAQMMHNSFASIIEHVDYESRNDAIRSLYASMIETLRKE